MTAKKTEEAKPLPIDPTVQDVIDVVDAASADPTIQVTVSKVTPKIGAKARSIIYTLGTWLGVVGVIAPIVAASLTGNAQIAVASIGALALSLTNALAKANLSKTADDIAKEAPVA